MRLAQLKRKAGSLSIWINTTINNIPAAMRLEKASTDQRPVVAPNQWVRRSIQVDFPLQDLSWARSVAEQLLSLPENRTRFQGGARVEEIVT